MTQVEPAGVDAGRSRALVTGFGPFAGHPRNPSQEIAAELHGRRLQGYEVVSCALDTSWSRAWFRLQAAAEIYRPDALIMLGVCNDGFFRLEGRARNAFTPEADVNGVIPALGNRRELVLGGPSAYSTTLPFASLLDELRLAADPATTQPPKIGGIEVVASVDAGEFICNQVYYLACHFLSPTISRIGFVHVPPLGFFGGGTGGPEDTTAAGVELVSAVIGLLAGKRARQRSEALRLPTA